MNYVSNCLVQKMVENFKTKFYITKILNILISYYILDYNLDRLVILMANLSSTKINKQLI